MEAALYQGIVIQRSLCKAIEICKKRGIFPFKSHSFPLPLK